MTQQDSVLPTTAELVTLAKTIEAGKGFPGGVSLQTVMPNGKPAWQCTFKYLDGVSLGFAKIGHHPAATAFQKLARGHGHR